MCVNFRFSDENRSQINSIAFQTFGFGPRNCMGMRFAQMELKLVLAKLLRKYQLRINSQVFLKLRKVRNQNLILYSIFCFRANLLKQ